MTATAGEGGSITAGYAAGKKVTKGTEVTLTATPGASYHFAGWYKGATRVSTNATYTFTVNENTTLIARFEKDTPPVPTYRFTLQVVGDGKVYEYQTDAAIKYQSGVTFTAGTAVALRAENGTGYTFAGWYMGETCISTNASYTFTVNEEMTVTAKFTAIPMATVKIICEGGGTIRRDGQTVDLSSGFLFPIKDYLTVTAVPDSGKVFVGWYIGTERYSTVEELSYSVEGDVTLTAKFANPISGLKLDPSNGTGFGEEGGILYALKEKGSTGAPYPEAMRVFLVYSNGDPNKRLGTNEFTIDLGGYDASKLGRYTITYTYTADPTIKATAVIEVVEKVAYLSTDVNGLDNGTFTWVGTPYQVLYKGAACGSRLVAAGSSVTLEAKRITMGYFFKGWYRKSDKQLLSTEETYTFTMPEEGLEIYAVVEEAITVNVTKEGQGDVYIDGQKVNFGDKTSVAFDVRPGTQWRFTATPAQNYEKNGWTALVPRVGTDTKSEETLTVTFGPKEDGYDGYTTITAVFDPKVVSLRIDTASAKLLDFYNGIRQHLIGVQLPDMTGIKFTGVRADNTTTELKTSDIKILTDALEAAIAGNKTGLCDVTFAYAKDENVKTTLQFNLIDRAGVTVQYVKELSYLDHAYNGKAAFISPDDILITYNEMSYKMSAVTCQELLALLSWEWRDVGSNTVVEVKDGDVTINGVRVDNFGPTNRKRSIGEELVGPCTAGSYRFTLRYNGAEVVTTSATITQNAFQKITTPGDFTTSEGSTWVNFGLYYNTVVGVGADGNYYVMQMPKIGSNGEFEAEARLVTPEADGTLKLGTGLDFAFVKINYVAGTNVYWPSDDNDPEHKLSEFMTGYYGSYFERSSDATSDGTQFGSPAIYRTGYTTVSGGHISRQYGNKNSNTYGNLTLFDATTGAVTIYAPRAGQTEKDRLRLVKDGDRYVFTSKNADEDTRQSFDIFLYRTTEQSID